MALLPKENKKIKKKKEKDNMHLINPNNNKPFASSKTLDAVEAVADLTLTAEEKKKRHYATIKLHAEKLLKECGSDIELRAAIIDLYHSKLREHRVEVTAHPENSVNYLMASLEVFQVCLQNIFMTMQKQAEEELQVATQLTHAEEEKLNDNGTKDKA